MNNWKNKPKNAVASGSYHVSTRKQLILEAYLGSCVGVTLYDRKAEIGGLIHLLLPESSGSGSTWRPEAYATSGMPLFLNALIDEGLDPSNLKASIAGGALIGPVSKRDLDLDIGGRTTEVVQQFLRQADIPVVEAETGGYLGCRLSLDLITFKSMMQPLGLFPDNESEVSEAPSAASLDAAVKTVLPIPQVALKIIRMINQGYYQMADVAGEIKTDQIISAKIIQMCNSTYLGTKQKVDSIDRALVIIGEQKLLKMVVSASMETYFNNSGDGYSLCRGGLFQHALQTGLVAQKLAEFTGKASPDIAYTAGLLHDIGKVVLDQYLFAHWPFFYRRTQIDGVALCTAESEKFGMSHPEAGFRLAEAWSLPENLGDAILHHHQPEAAEIDSELAHIIHLADLLISRFQVGHGLGSVDTKELAPRMIYLGLQPSKFPLLVELIPQDTFGSIQH